MKKPNISLKHKTTIIACLSALVAFTIGFRIHDITVSTYKRTTYSLANAQAAWSGKLDQERQSEVAAAVASASAQAKVEGKAELAQQIQANPNQFMKYNPTTGKVELDFTK